MTKIQSKIVDQQNVSREFSKGIANILDAVTTISDILNDMKNEMKDFKEKGKIMPSQISTSTQRFSQIEETLNKIPPQLVDQRSVSSELLNGVANVREEVTTVSNGLNVVKIKIAEIKEKTSKVNTSIQACRRIEESLDTLKITEQKMEVFHNKTQNFGFDKDERDEMRDRYLRSQGSHRNSKKHFHDFSMIFHDQQCNFHDHLMHGLQLPLLASSSPH